MANLKFSEYPTITILADTDLFLVSEDAGSGAFNTKGITSKVLLTRPIRTEITAYTAVTTDYTILCNAIASSFTVTLPTAVDNAGKVFIIKKIDGTGNTVTIDADGIETIDGELTQPISTQYDAITVQSDDTNWYII